MTGLDQELISHAISAGGHAGAPLLRGGQGGVVRLPPFRRGLLGSVAVGLSFLRAVDAVETDAFRVVVVQDFDRVAVED